MKKITLLVAMMATTTFNYLSAQTTSPAPYCVDDFDDEPFNVPDAINSVSIETLTNAQSAAPHYTFYNNLAVPDLTKGASYPLKVEFMVNGGCGYGEQDVITHFSMNLEVGKIYLWKGKNGSGKPMTAHILLGLIQPKKGQFFINDIETAWVDLSLFRNRFSFLNQDSPIFMGSLQEDILFGHPNENEAV